ncbi:glycoside hydrolase family 3 N-terminal domain-containing protein [Streptomyces sp. SL13]|uniref:Glycoside hydrolase family 3 N-terminal domain-containing protein n=1 Tax=Streptantibioticus silvisoli TaxID=2705255 RepID=A0AA90KAG3_9ACTN|nr:glycoside hydrolase family 3 N-terminal domain-containing protein [Streptantibioticus silvisoli]MDI5972388.1 glycoside hydrolase family 3 N-terminal domain-containing protein [Streptantibioticus silvisoli]
MDEPRSLHVRRRTLLAATGAAVAAASVTTTAAAAATRLPGAARPAALTAAQTAGQRVIWSYPGLTPPQSLLTAISYGHAAGVIFFGENISSNSQIASVIAQLNEANASNPVKSPLLMMTDQEGGQVRRLSGAPTLSEKQIGASSQASSQAASAGTGAGQNLLSASMNMNLAPVLDVYRTAGDFDDQYGRSYSTDPAVCSSLGSVFIHSQQQTGVVACAKHFPGLGAATASEDTDAGPVTLTQSLSDLRNIDEYPYAAAITSGVKSVMVSWAIYTALDSTNPAGFSSAIIQGELRDRLGFTGVTITDALEAGAIPSSMTTAQRSVKAAGAGMDLLLCSARDVSQGIDAVNALADAYTSGSLPKSAFDAAVSRVQALRASI